METPTTIKTPTHILYYKKPTQILPDMINCYGKIEMYSLINTFLREGYTTFTIHTFDPEIHKPD
jgi:hypothetical protein